MEQFKELVQKELVFINEEALDKDAVIRFLTEKICNQYGMDCGDLAENILNREKGHSSGIGAGLAFPHARILNLEEIRIAVMVSRTPIEFQSLDGNPAQLVFLFFSPLRHGREHLSFLHFITVFANSDVYQKALAVKTPDEFVKIWQDLCNSEK